LRRIGAYSKKRVNKHDIRGAVMAIIGNERDIRRIGNNHNDDRLPARLLAVGEVAHFLGVHTSTVRRWEKKGLLRSYAIGLRNSLRFKQEDVLSFLNKSRKKSIGAA
jgi:excisionase family DNA binding protein